MRSFRFTSTGTAGDNSNQQQNISCDVKMMPSTSTVSTDQAPKCDCHTDKECDAQAQAQPQSQAQAQAQAPANQPYSCSGPGCSASSHVFTPGACGSHFQCDKSQNICDFTEDFDGNTQEFPWYHPDNPQGHCISCENLRTVQDCIDRKDWNFEETFQGCLRNCAGYTGSPVEWWGPRDGCRHSRTDCPANKMCEFNIEQNWGDSCIDCPGTTAESCRDRCFYDEKTFNECVDVCAGGNNPNGITFDVYTQWP